MRLQAILLALLVSLPLPATAQDDCDASTAEEVKAVQLIDSSGTQRVYESTMDEMVRMQMENNPQLAPYEQVLRDFLREYMAWPDVRCEYARAYAERFTAAELEELIDFYSTDTGAKLIQVLPEIQTSSMQYGQRRVQEHLPELYEMLQEEMSADPSL